MGNKFTGRRRHALRPPICISKPPPKPYQYPPYPAPGAGGEFNQDWQWIMSATLPTVPNPPFQTITVRNLAFHCYPNPANQAWLQNLDQIRKRWQLFNGKRIIAVATGPGLLRPEVVQEFLGPDAEYLILKNDPRLREAASFHTLLTRLRSTELDEATFFAHSKGSTSHGYPRPDKELGIRYWRNRMYHQLLDGWPDVHDRLQNAYAVGTFKIDYSHLPDYLMTSPTGLDWGDWHFAGTFFWFRHDCIYRNPHWSEIADDPYAAEMWLGNLIPSECAQSVYQPWCAFDHPPPDLYNPDTHLHPIA